MKKINDGTATADEIASATPATDTTGEPVTEQAPTDTPVTSTQDTAMRIDTATPALPADYLADGTFLETAPDGKHHFLKRDYVDRYAKELAATFTNGTPALSAAAFRSAFLRDAKKLLRRGTPDGAKLTAAATMQVQATKLASQRKAPAILQDMMSKATAAVTDAETYQALYTHLDSVYTFMLQAEHQQKGGEL